MTERDFMLRAIGLAERGRGDVEPNPMVGCVIVREGRVLGEGWHKKFGGPHAEVEALADCARRGHSPVGGHAFVSLEPCCHTGKTGPCTEALIAAKIARVSAATLDPFPRVAGGGAAALRAAGVAVDVGLCAAEAERVLAPFFKRVKTGRPWVITKWAQTIDGKIATSTGDSKWISNDMSRRVVHELRARVDAVVVGAGTAVADDPMLTAREVTVHRVARRVVVDPRLRTPRWSKLITSIAANGPVTLATTPAMLQSPAADALRAAGAEVVALGARVNGRLAIDGLMEHLSRAHGATNVLVEGGAGLLGSVMDEGLADELLVFVGPRVIGDAAATSPVAGSPCAMVSAARRFELRSVSLLGHDVLLRYDPHRD